jgi:YVTN family beta-propeller protein
VTSESDNSVHAIDVATGRERRNVPVGRRPRDIAFLPDGSALFVSNEAGASVTRIDAVSGAVAATIALPEGSLPMGLAVSPDAVRLYVATGRGGEVLAIDTRTNEVVGRVKVGRRPWGIALTRDGDKLYAANGPSHDVSVVDVRNASAMRVVKTLPVGQLAWGVAVGRRP